VTKECGVARADTDIRSRGGFTLKFRLGEFTRLDSTALASYNRVPQHARKKETVWLSPGLTWTKSRSLRGWS